MPDMVALTRSMDPSLTSHIFFTLVPKHKRQETQLKARMQDLHLTRWPVRTHLPLSALDICLYQHGLLFLRHLCVLHWKYWLQDPFALGSGFHLDPSGWPGLWPPAQMKPVCQVPVWATGHTALKDKMDLVSIRSLALILLHYSNSSIAPSHD